MQEYWSGLPCPPPEDLPNPGIEPTSLMSPALAGGYFTTSATWEATGGSIDGFKGNRGQICKAAVLALETALHWPGSVLLTAFDQG